MAIALACIGVLAIAVMISPDKRGVGTHQQLGLSECQFESQTALPCPTCGMTTSFAHFVRGQVVASFYIQPMGMVLALLTMLTFWIALYVAMSGRPAHRLLNMVPGRYYAIPLLVFGVLAWAWKMWIHITGRDGW